MGVVVRRGRHCERQKGPASWDCGSFCEESDHPTPYLSDPRPPNADTELGGNDPPGGDPPPPGDDAPPF